MNPSFKNMNIIDRKFEIFAINPVNGHAYTEEDALLLCAKDAAVPAALEAYRGKCIELGANPEHIESVSLLLGRVEEFQRTVQSRVPDTVGEEVNRCVHGKIQPPPTHDQIRAMSDIINPAECMDYQTRSGRPVRLLCSDAEGPRPFVFLLQFENGDEFPVSYAANGYRTGYSTAHPADIVRTPPNPNA